MRLFIAVNFDSQVREAIHSATEPLRQILPEARWVSAGLLHMTVKFLGEQDEAMATSVTGALDRIVTGYRAMSAGIRGVDAFPNLRRPSVVWIGVHSDTKLELLHHDVEQACDALGLPLEGKAFRPHITLARVRSAPPDAVRALGRAATSIEHESRTWVRSLDLMLSEHRNGKLTYSALHRAALRGD